MDLTELLRELRLMKGQEGYRFCLAWVAVVIHVAWKPASLAIVAGLLVANGADSKIAGALTHAVLLLARSLGK